MLEEYRKSLQMIAYTGKKLTKKQYNQMAKKYNLLSVASMQFISKCSFQRLVRATLE